MAYAAGVDVGSTQTKAVLVDEDERIVGRALTDTGANVIAAAQQAFATALADAGAREEEVEYVIGTGTRTYDIRIRETGEVTPSGFPVTENVGWVRFDADNGASIRYDVDYVNVGNPAGSVSTGKVVAFVFNMGVDVWRYVDGVVNSTRVGVVAELCDELDISVIVPFRSSPRTLARAVQRAIDERERRIHRCRALARECYDARRMGRDWQEALRRIAGHELTLAPPAGRLCVGPGSHHKSDGRAGGRRAGSRQRDNVLRPGLPGTD